jgi:hypothetical protein
MYHNLLFLNKPHKIVNLAIEDKKKLKSINGIESENKESDLSDFITMPSYNTINDWFLITRIKRG